MTIRVIIADDHPIVRDGLKMTIERASAGIAVVGEAGDGLELLKAAESIEADVYVVDVTMPNLNGIDATRALLARAPGARIVMLSLHDTKAIVEEALAAGARGYLTKEIATKHIVEAVTEVHAGRFYLSPQVAHFVVEAGLEAKRGKKPRKNPATAALTPQERSVLQLVAEGKSNKEIAKALHCAVNTVHAHRNHLMAKLDIHKQADLVRYAIKAGIAKL